jgi:integrase
VLAVIRALIEQGHVSFEGFQLRDSRHSWAVRAAKAGTPAEVIARQLGHASSAMVQKVYGRFMPDAHDRDKWERIAALQDEAARATARDNSRNAGEGH